MFSLAFAYLRAKPLASTLHLAILALGVAALVAMLLVTHQIEQRLNRDAASIDMVVGAKGSPMQLILSALYQLDSPTGNITLSSLDTLRQHPLVAQAVPLALGDNFKGFRIIGTAPDYVNLYQGKLAQGRLFTTTMEATLGARVAAVSGLKLGDTFQGSHGLGEGGEVHAVDYTVVGILEPTGTLLDRVILTPVSSVWHVHSQHHHADDDHDHAHHHHDDDHHHDHAHDHPHDDASATEEGREITAALVTFRSPAAFASLPRYINANTNMQAAVPAQEAARLFTVFGLALTALEVAGVLFVVMAAASLFVALTSALQQRQYDLALLRLLGAKPRQVFMLVIYEALILALMGVLLGLGLGHLAVETLPLWVPRAADLNLTGALFIPAELFLILAALALALLAALWPAWRAYRLRLAEVLGKR